MLLKLNTVSEDVIKWQTILKAQGYNIGAIDGIFGPPLSVSISAPSTSINYSANITITASATGGEGAKTYKWFLDTVEMTGETSSSITIVTPSAGSHNIECEVTDASGTDSDNLVFFVGTISGSATLVNSATQTYTTNVNSPTWSIVSGLGSINSSTGQFTVPSTGSGETVIKATNSGDSNKYATKRLLWGFPRTIVLDANTLSYAKNLLPSGHTYSARVRSQIS